VQPSGRGVSGGRELHGKPDAAGDGEVLEDDLWGLEVQPGGSGAESADRFSWADGLLIQG